MLPNEFLDVLGELKVSLALHVVLERGNHSREVWNGDRDAALTADFIYLAPETSVDSSCLEEPFDPARVEWVMTNVPRIEQDQLLSIQVGARGDWYDDATDTVYKTPGALRRLSKIWKIWRRHLRFPMLARYIVTGSERLYRDIGYKRRSSRVVESRRPPSSGGSAECRVLASAYRGRVMSGGYSFQNYVRDSYGHFRHARRIDW